MDKIIMKTTSKDKIKRQALGPESPRTSPPMSLGASQPQQPQQHDRPGRGGIPKAVTNGVRSQSAEPSRMPSIFRSMARNASNVARWYNDKANAKYNHQGQIDPPMNGVRGPNKLNRGGRPMRSNSFAHPPSKGRQWQGEPISGPVERIPPRTAGKTGQTDGDIDDETTARILASPNHSDPVISQINATMEDDDDRLSPPKLGPVESGAFDVQINAGDTDKKLSELQQQLDDKDELIQDLKNKLQKKEESLEFMRKKAADAAAKAANMPPALVLLRSDEELINGWNDLAHEISNFVGGYFKKVDRKNRDKWMTTNKKRLKEISPSYTKIATDSKQHLHWLIEALIWRLLRQYIFGSSTNEAPVAWGGPHGDLLSQLGDAFMERLEPEDERFQRLYHHWKALSTNLFDMAGLQEMAESRVNKIMEVLGGALGDLLSPSSAKDTLYLKCLLSIVRNATYLDRLFSGQMKWYLAFYPPERHSTEPRPSRIRFATSNGSAASDRFTMRPALCRAGGSDGEIYNSFGQIVPHVVKP